MGSGMLAKRASHLIEIPSLLPASLLESLKVLLEAILHFSLVGSALEYARFIRPDVLIDLADVLLVSIGECLRLEYTGLDL